MIKLLPYSHHCVHCCRYFVDFVLSVPHEYPDRGMNLCRGWPYPRDWFVHLGFSEVGLKNERKRYTLRKGSVSQKSVLHSCLRQGILSDLSENVFLHSVVQVWNHVVLARSGHFSSFSEYWFFTSRVFFAQWKPYSVSQFWCFCV